MTKFILLLCLVCASASAQKIVQLTDLHHNGTLHDVTLGYGRYSGGDNTYNDIGKGARVITLTPGAPIETYIISFQ